MNLRLLKWSPKIEDGVNDTKNYLQKNILKIIKILTIQYKKINLVSQYLQQ